MRKRIAQIDFLKGAAIILVVLGHVISQVWNTDPDIYENNLIFRFCYSFHMPLFVFISGYLSRVTFSPGKSWLLKRFKRIGIPLAVMLFVFYAVLKNGSPADFLHPTPYWYLIFLLISDSLLALDEHFNFKRITFAAAYIILGAAYVLIKRDIDILSQLMSYLPFYTAGLFLPELWQRRPENFWKLCGTAAVLFLIFLPFYGHGTVYQLKRLENITGISSPAAPLKAAVLFTGKFIMPCLGICFSALITKLIYKLKSAAPICTAMEFIGQHTLMIYLLHDLCFVKFTGKPLLDTTISLLTGLLLPLAMSVIFRKLQHDIRYYLTISKYNR